MNHKKTIEYHCDICNISIKSSQAMTNHLESKKHKNNLLPKNLFPLKCQHCSHTATTKANLKYHFLRKHASVEERIENSKYYCSTCDLMFPCEHSFNKHKVGIVHRNKEKLCKFLVKNSDQIN